MNIFRFILVALVFELPMLAHDYWLEPDTFTPALDTKVSVRLFVGDHFVSEKERAFQKKRTVRFRWLTTKMAHDLALQGREGAKPFIQFSPKHKGQHLLTLQRDWAHIELEAEKFNGYLEHEGLKDILKIRRDSGEENSVGKERYRRYLKSLIQVGDRDDEIWKRRMGHRLEIIPLSNPYGHKTGDYLKVLVYFEGKPLPGAQLEAYQRGPQKVTTQMRRTDKSGKATIELIDAGPWLLRLVHMRRCVDDPKVDWESFWSAYSFAMPENKKQQLK